MKKMLLALALIVGMSFAGTSVKDSSKAPTKTSKVKVKKTKKADSVKKTDTTKKTPVKKAVKK